MRFAHTVIFAAFGIGGFLHSCIAFQRMVRRNCLVDIQMESSSSTYHLPKKLEELAISIGSVREESLRYKQLLFLATKAKPLPIEYKTSENLVPGCMSTVHVHAELDKEGKVQFLGDSDSQLTKGLVSFLVNGLSGSFPEEIVNIKPDFIKIAGLSQSLTPGRNNGFLNMLHLMKEKAKALGANKSAIPVDSLARNVESTSNPVQLSILKKLKLLRPTSLTVTDNSAAHASHKEMRGELSSKESHFTINIIADCFDRLSLVQRHQLIYTLLEEEMNRHIHALSITAKTPSESAVVNS